MQGKAKQTFHKGGLLYRLRGNYKDSKRSNVRCVYWPDAINRKTKQSSKCSYFNGYSYTAYPFDQNFQSSERLMTASEIISLSIHKGKFLATCDEWK